MKIALTIGGSDTSCGAGIQMDLKCFNAINVHGVCVITAITSQTHLRVKSINPLSPATIRKQIDVLQHDLKINAVKTGMLYSADIVKTVAKSVADFQVPVVVDPVISATAGGLLCTGLQNFSATLKKTLLPIATVVTPNLVEAEFLTAGKIRSEIDLKKCAQQIYNFGCKYVLIKGGHYKHKYAKDVLFDGTKFYYFSAPFISKSFHGAGCALSAYLTGWLAKNLDVITAVKFAKKCITQSLLHSYSIAAGNAFLQPMPIIFQRYERKCVKLKLYNSVQQFLKLLKADLIPRVGINFVYALPNANSPVDVCGIENRIKSADTVVPYEKLKFGASKHIATVVLTASKFDKSIRAGINLKYTHRNIDACKKTGLKIGRFERAEEPPGQSTMAWGTEQAILEKGFVPDIIYDLGAAKKEPMIRILGEEPEDVLKKVKLIVGLL